jgi:hypothetical protein
VPRRLRRCPRDVPDVKKLDVVIFTVGHYNIRGPVEPAKNVCEVKAKVRRAERV